MNIGKNIGPSLLVALHADRHEWKEISGELVDNGFDAGASRVDIHFGGQRTLVVSDDGFGCPDIERMLTLGTHMHSPSTKLGRYGVGLKDAMCWLWCEVYIQTVHDGILRETVINVPKLAGKETWELPDPIESPANGTTGTKIIFTGCEKSFPDYAQLASELGYIFSPGLRSGRQIVLSFDKRKPILCEAWMPPRMDDAIDTTLTVNGCEARLVAGIVPEGVANPRWGFNYFIHHRMILNSSVGSNGHSTSRICGTVELTKGWRLSKNKTDVLDNFEPLAAKIWEVCEPLILKAEVQASTIANREIERDVTAKLRDAVKTAKAKRSAGNGHGTIHPAGTKRRHRRASKTQPGHSISLSDMAGKFRMEFKDMEPDKIGQVDLPGIVVYLNPQHSRIAHHKANDYNDALVDLCLTLLLHEQVDKQQQQSFPVFRNYNDFMHGLSSVLGGQLVAATESI